MIAHIVAVTTRLCPVDHKQPHISHDCVAEIEKRAEAAEAKLERVVEALGEIRGRCLAAKTHEVGPLEAKGRLTRILELACAALAAAKGE